MRIRILTTVLAVGGLLAAAPASDAVSPTVACEAASQRETGASNITGGAASYTLTQFTPSSVPSEVPENGVVAETDTSAGTLDGFMVLGAKACSNITYTITAYDDDVVNVPDEVDDPLLDTGITVADRTPIASTSTVRRLSGSTPGVGFTLDVPLHQSRCVWFVVSTSNAVGTLLDRAPDDLPVYSEACSQNTGGGGSQYWN